MIRGSSATLYARLSRWLGTVRPDTLPPGNITVSMILMIEFMEWRYSRSGGPGGQHVNKVSSKAELRLSLGWLPSDLPNQPIPLLLRSDRHRSLQLNKEECLQKAVDSIRELVRRYAPPPTTVEQQEKMEGL